MILLSGDIRKLSFMKYKNIRELEIKVDSRLPFVALPCLMRQFFFSGRIVVQNYHQFYFPLNFFDNLAIF